MAPSQEWGRGMNSKANKADVLEAIHSGAKYRAIARHFGITHQRVSQIARDAGVRRGRGHNPLSPSEKASIVVDYLSGVPKMCIKVQGRSRFSVTRTLVKAGIYTPEAKPPPRSEADKAFVREHYGKLTAWQIAQARGMTRNAVIGLANRLSLTKPKEAAHA